MNEDKLNRALEEIEAVHSRIDHLPDITEDHMIELAKAALDEDFTPSRSLNHYPLGVIIVGRSDSHPEIKVVLEKGWGVCIVSPKGGICINVRACARVLNSWGV